MPANNLGFSLVELLVAMAIGVVLVGGALTVHIQSHDAHTFAERMARIQENGRFAVDTISPDIRLAGFWGRTEKAGSISRRTGDALNPMPAAMTPANDCYAGYFTNVTRRIEAANEDQLGAANPFAACIPDTARLPGTDILVVRHAAATATAPANIVNGRVYIISNALTAELFVGGLMPIPAGYGAADTIHEVEVNAYYVSPNSSAGVGIPALNRLELGDGPLLVNQELISGVEDLQVQLGIDTDGTGSVNSYVNPGSAAIAGATIIANRAWVRVRGERVDLDYTDGATYEYADRQVEPNDSFRRMLLSKTLRIRNGLGT
ncbi:MAG: PilW family protein [Gammaproteobacteria bacterium]|nr:PilW family protein [Gammaproteobacteria bacterium]NNF60536.1 prepilin-type N-terminal cleavage/methylation domain-containing protein [Gammaproteobacteria bacterium]NNM20282.1 prepilin-type N-terminal cleavage/methylation domain-containing protein [Gammaproteobacteria bacterium]